MRPRERLEWALLLALALLALALLAWGAWRFVPCGGPAIWCP